MTDRDLVVRVLAQTDRYLDQVRADDVMSKPVLTARDDDDLAEALAVMRAGGVRRLAVVDANGAVVGLLSFDDLICHLQGSLGEFAALLRRP
ncbi:MAG TPA: CBS domain-containing protein [Polyangiaceae bacterium]|nr:CBS domain-containing protein [Polyangiaceae bacterium]